MKKINLIIIAILIIFIIKKYFYNESFKNFNNKFEYSIFQINSQNIKFNWIEPFKYKRSYEAISTGFLIDKEGHILTCSHAIENSMKVYVTLPAIGKESFEADVLKFCPRIDIALLKIKDFSKFKKTIGNKIHPLKLGDSDKIKPGELSLALGYPLGEDKLKRTSGIVSGIQDSYIQTDTAINSGNSGGPLLNKNNEVIGINFAVHKKGTNIGFAVPIKQYFILKDSLMTKNNKKIIKTPILGAESNNSNNDLIKYISGGRINNGYYISSVYKNGTLYNAGIRKGDILLEFDNNKLDLYGESKVSWSYEKVNLIELLLRLKANSIVNIKYFSSKSKKIISKNVKLVDSDFYQVKNMYPSFESIQYLIFGGCIFMNLTMNHTRIFKSLKHFKFIKNRIDKKLIVSKILPGSFINLNKIFRHGTIIKKINNIDVNDITTAKNALKKPLISNNIKYIKIEDENNKVFISTLSRLLKEEQFLSKNHRYQKNNLF